MSAETTGDISVLIKIYFQKGEFAFFLQVKKGELYLCLLFLNCLQLKIIFRSKRYILGVTYSGFLYSLVNYLLIFTDLFFPPPLERQCFVSVLRILFMLVIIIVFVSSVGNP